MEFFNNLNFNILNNYYNDIYNEILNSCNENDNILFINNNYFNPLINFSHIIKKLKLNIYIIYNNKDNINLIEKEIKDDECYDNIHINFTNIDDMYKINNKINFKKIIILHINSLDYLNNNLNLVKNFYNNNNFEVIFFISLSNNNEKYTDNKNSIRNYIKYNFNYNLGYEFNFDIFLNNINNNKTFKIKKLGIFKETNYAFYGKSDIYKIILNKMI